MRKSLLPALLLSLGVLSLTSTLFGEITVFASYWNPSSDEESTGAGFSVRNVDHLVYFELRGTYFEEISDESPLFQNRLQVIPVDFGLGMQVDLLKWLNIYGGGGISYYFMESTTAVVDNELGYYLQAGTKLKFYDGFGIFAEVVWRKVQANFEEDINLSDSNFDLQGTSVNVGIAFVW
jgi:hypothetical protein